MNPPFLRFRRPTSTLGPCLIAIALGGAAIAAPPQPNILVIVGDDMGYADVGFHGCKDIPTPNLDALAASGVRFTNGYVTGPYCSPTRAGLLTGRYQTRFGHEFNSGGAGGGLPLTETTLADRLKAAGYATGIVGKWHLGSSHEDKDLAAANPEKLKELQAKWDAWNKLNIAAGGNDGGGPSGGAEPGKPGRKKRKNAQAAQ